MIKAKDAMIAWNGADSRLADPSSPPGSVAVGPLINAHESDWTRGYLYSGGAAHTNRRTMTGAEQRFQVMRDWYELVYGYGLHPFVVHTAFLRIDEYQEIIKEMGMGPDRGELGHDPEVGYGRAGDFPVPEIDINHIGQSVHVWPRA
ncbi:hypothetical protein HJB72_28540 [Rhizobium lentis]|uniref:hypothetical protein n=1 Tax=Rhizobium lentis TaxID=1138194 RepID=UPI001C83C1A3|nr:hypothetical protein [Rhizobium lentis]MBX5001874.1 hypothetical protein [Rhizobium lentis]